jgi:hemoglobin
MTDISLFDAIGGAPTVDALVERFYANMDLWADAQHIRALHPADLTRTRAVFKDYLSEWLGGPALYSPVHGHPRLRMRHMQAPIGAGERDAWLACMQEALDTTVADRTSRIQIYANMEKLADWMRNKPD